jgi:hypothetical protein
MGIGAVISLQSTSAPEGIRTPIGFLVDFTRRHRFGLFVGRADDIVFCTHDIVTGPIEANHNDERL